ncbi:MAG: tripartite tricarboxylate transporter permease, partial [Alicyclobacillus sp.]|nr:tripartite tricarboxylate transporter permease [Alicyclobacillus sp.]
VMDWGAGLHIFLSLPSIAALILGTLVGLFMGVLPGLGGVFALTIFIPLTFSLSAAPSIIFLVAVHTAGVFGGAIIAILINTPGTPGNIATTFDGYPLAQQGRAMEAIVATGIAGAIAGMFSVIVVILFAPAVVSFGLKINPADYFMLAVFGLSLVAAAAHGNTLAGIVLGGVGFLLSMMGRDPITGASRFDWHLTFLSDNGINFSVMVIGLFALSNAFIMLEEARHPSQIKVPSIPSLTQGIRKGFMEIVRHPMSILRSTILGTVLGAVPGIGISISNMVAYVVETKFNKRGGFGAGNIAGPIVAEAADNATMPAELIPTFLLGIPGGAASALLLSALTIHGLQPGMAFFQGHGESAAIFIAMFFTQIVMAVLGVLLSRFLAQAVKIPKAVLAPIIVVLSCVGAYAIESSVFDIFLALLFGVVGYLLLRLKYPIAPLVLGDILGQLAESNYRRAAVIGSATHASPFLHPFPIALAIISLLAFLLPILLPWLRLRGRAGGLQNHRSEAT